MSRALVLGGGGVTGIAWELGVLAALAEHGTDLTSGPTAPDLIIGTSAGALVGAQVAARVPLARRYADELRTDPAERRQRVRLRTLVQIALAAARATDQHDFLVRIGELARTARTVPQAQRHAEVARWLSGVDTWPATPLLVTAVDAVNGQFRVFDRTVGVDLVTAVAASLASPGVRPPSTIDGRPYYDGGFRSAVNADLAAGHDRVLVLAPVHTGRPPFGDPAAEIAELAETAQVIRVVPDAAAVVALGRGAGAKLDPARRPAAARAGYAQGRREAAAISELWPRRAG
jgi:NTE family protein